MADNKNLSEKQTAYLQDVIIYLQRTNQDMVALDPWRDTHAWMAWRRWRLAHMPTRLVERGSDKLASPFMDDCYRRGVKFYVPTKWPWDFDATWEQQKIVLTADEQELNRPYMTDAQRANHFRQIADGRSIVDEWRKRLGDEFENVSAPKVYRAAADRGWTKVGAANSLQEAIE